MNISANMNHFCNWIVDVLVDTEVCMEVLPHVKSRVSLLSSLRYRNKQGVLSERPPSRVDIFAMVVGPWPSIVFGGPRYLHQVRRHFLIQCQVLKDANVKQWNRLMPYNISKQMNVSASYGISGLKSPGSLDSNMLKLKSCRNQFLQL